MRLGIDLDGVVADFNSGWMELYNDEFGTDLSADQVTQWNGINTLTHFASMRAFWHWAQRGDEPSIFRHFDTFPGAVESLDTLASDHEIVIITTKPRWAVHDTYAWIADKQLPTREIHVTADKWRIGCDVYLEDSPYQLPKLVEHRPESVVCRFVRSWNRPVAGARDVRSWESFVAIVREVSGR
ncbi:MAG: hypothetical protein ACE5GC_00090 [Acidimicrobiia bacterium]